MKIDAAFIQLLRESIGDEITVCEFEGYYEGNPQPCRVRDIVKDNGELKILI